jgi:hypothetical protein
MRAGRKHAIAGITCLIPGIVRCETAREWELIYGA